MIIFPSVKKKDRIKKNAEGREIDDLSVWVIPEC